MTCQISDLEGGSVFKPRAATANKMAILSLSAFNHFSGITANQLCLLDDWRRVLKDMSTQKERSHIGGVRLRGKVERRRENGTSF
jgi:hypothetical protein